MTIDRHGGEVVIHCDHCPEYVETGEEDFSEALELARSDGWRAYRDRAGEWCHRCPACMEDFKSRGEQR